MSLLSPHCLLGFSVILRHQNENDMEKKNDIPEKLYADEAVRFIASRYRVTTQEVVRDFLVQSGIVPDERVKETSGFRLEDNEIEIIKGLMDAYSSTKGKNLNT